MAQNGPHQDRLLLSQLRSPMLNEVMRSPAMREEVLDIAEEIKVRWMAKVPADSGNLRSTATVRALRSPEYEDRRWVADFTAGGPRAPYAPAVEAETHALAEVLREMGYGGAVGGTDRVGPTGVAPKEISTPADPAPRAVKEAEANLNAGETRRLSSEPGWNIRSADEIRRDKAEGERALAAEATARRKAYEESKEYLAASTEENYGRVARLVDDLNRRRVGSKASEAAYFELAKERYFQEKINTEPGSAEAAQFARFGLAAHERARESKGLTPRPDVMLPRDER